MASTKLLVNLEKKPKLSELHACCDYIELLCVVHCDGEISRADVLDRFRDSLDVDMSPIFDSEDSELDVIDVEDGSPTERNDKFERLLADWFEHLKSRQRVFGEFYPFIVTEDGDVLQRTPEVSIKHKFYLFLLLASGIRYVMSLKPALTTCFETVSQRALAKCLPVIAEVHVFGTSAAKGGRYSGNKWQKIQRLARDIRVSVKITEDKIPPNDSGDGGLDIVAWVPLADEADGMICVFGQCACTEDWVVKQHSSSYETWNAMLSLPTRPYNIVFIPFFFRDSIGGWWRPQDIHRTVLMDRLRLVLLLESDYSFIEDHSIYRQIEVVLTYRESMV